MVMFAHQNWIEKCNEWLDDRAITSSYMRAPTSKATMDATGWVRPIDFNVINPELSMLCSCGARQATCHASSGSSWTTREARVH